MLIIDWKTADRALFAFPFPIPNCKRFAQTLLQLLVHETTSRVEKERVSEVKSIDVRENRKWQVATIKARVVTSDLLWQFQGFCVIEFLSVCAAGNICLTRSLSYDPSGLLLGIDAFKTLPVTNSKQIVEQFKCLNTLVDILLINSHEQEM